MNVAEFAEKLKINLRTYYRYESGEREIPAGLMDLAEIIRSNLDANNGQVKQQNIQYDQHGGWKPRSIEEIAGVPEGLGMGRAVEMLARIYQSKNRDVISAICANLRVFCERIDQDDELSALKREMEDLRALVKNHARAHAYYGEDRRSGTVRRQIVGDSPTGIERRSGGDRRRLNLGNVTE